MKKILILLVALVVLVLLGLHLYYNVYKHGYEDKKYNFILLDTRGWGILEPKEGVYLSLGTYRDDKIVSYFGISPVLKSSNKYNSSEVVEGLCNNTFSGLNHRNYNFSKVTINELSGYTCHAEVAGTKTNDTLISSEFILIGNGSNLYDYIISTSFPLDNVGEKTKVERLLNNFWTR